MVVVDESRPRLRVGRLTLGLLLTIVTVSHVAQAVGSSVTDTTAGSIGAALAYAVITVSVLLGGQLGYIAAVGLPLASFLYSDHSVLHARTDAVGVLYLGLYAAIVPLAAYLWYRSATDSRSD